MQYNLENVKVLVKKLRERKESTLRLKDKALRNYYTQIQNIEEDKRENSIHILFPQQLFETLWRRYMEDEIL